MYIEEITDECGRWIKVAKDCVKSLALVLMALKFCSSAKESYQNVCATNYCKNNREHRMQMESNICLKQ
jgi:hypothetical protein